MKRYLVFGVLVLATPALAHPSLALHVHPGVDWNTVAYGVGTMALAAGLSILVRQ
ncbi:MAG: hypothetical protein AB8B51_00515 [Sedimentitalea sp.]